MSEGPARRRRMIEGSQTSLHVHLVWGMHGRRPLLVSHLDQKLFRFMHLKLTQIGCRPRAIGAPTTTFTSLSRPVRRSPSLVWSRTSTVPHPSSRIVGSRFGWQAGCGAFTVATDELLAVDRDVVHQRAHHTSGTAQPDLECPSARGCAICVCRRASPGGLLPHVATLFSRFSVGRVTGRLTLRTMSRSGALRGGSPVTSGGPQGRSAPNSF